jgi:hypothetical protein
MGCPVSGVVLSLLTVLLNRRLGNRDAGIVDASRLGAEPR